MTVDAFAFFALIGTLCGAIGAGAAATAPYQHWMACVRRVSQNPLLMVMVQQSGQHGPPRGALLFDPTTMWIRVLLAGTAAAIFLICGSADHSNH